jgi:hypothetical protein
LGMPREGKGQPTADRATAVVSVLFDGIATLPDRGRPLPGKE